MAEKNSKITQGDSEKIITSLNEQVLEKLPETSSISGVGLNRTVWADSRLLSFEDSVKVQDYKSESFNWGYNGGGPKQLAFALLLHWLGDPQVALMYVNKLAANFVAKIDKNNFKTTLKVRTLIQDAIEAKNGLLDEAKIKEGYYFIIQDAAKAEGEV